MADALGWEKVRQAANGDAVARRDLVNTTIGGLWSLAMRLTRSPNDADDVVQETYARILPVLHTLQPTGQFEAYLARTAANLVIERWRRRRAEVEISEALASPGALEPWQTVADKEDDQRRLAAVWASIQKLEPAPRAAVLLFYAHGESCKGISEILQVPVGTVQTWLHRARIDVRQKAEILLRKQSAAGRPNSEDAS
jgi:RNA polymerase sigma-70 factor, ECF subfamily